VGWGVVECGSAGNREVDEAEVCVEGGRGRREVRGGVGAGEEGDAICVAVCCSVLQCVAVCCSVLQCVAVCCSV